MKIKYPKLEKKLDQSFAVKNLIFCFHIIQRNCLHLCHYHQKLERDQMESMWQMKLLKLFLKKLAVDPQTQRFAFLKNLLNYLKSLYSYRIVILTFYHYYEKT